MKIHSLYRRYRPRNFDEVKGQKWVIDILKNSITEKKMSHALIFSGQRGTGKTSVARILAKAINCSNLQGSNPCLECKSCILIENNCSDVIEIDAASHNSVEQIRDLLEQSTYIPLETKYKIFILDEVHMLTNAAFNAMLKLLEEPPAYLKFILATTHPEKVPLTVISRCQQFIFKKIDNSVIFEHLKYIADKDHLTINDHCIHKIARISEGSLRDALSALDQITLISQKKVLNEEIINQTFGLVHSEDLVNFLTLIIKKDMVSLLKYYDNFKTANINFIHIAYDIVNLICDIYKINSDDRFVSSEIPLNLLSQFKTHHKNTKFYKNLVQKIQLFLYNSRGYNDQSSLFKLLIFDLIDHNAIISELISDNNNNADNLDNSLLKGTNEENIDVIKKESFDDSFKSSFEETSNQFDGKPEINQSNDTLDFNTTDNFSSHKEEQSEPSNQFEDTPSFNQKNEFGTTDNFSTQKIDTSEADNNLEEKPKIIPSSQKVKSGDAKDTIEDIFTSNKPEQDSTFENKSDINQPNEEVEDDALSNTNSLFKDDTVKNIDDNLNDETYSSQTQSDLFANINASDSIKKVTSKSISIEEETEEPEKIDFNKINISEVDENIIYNIMMVRDKTTKNKINEVINKLKDEEPTFKFNDIHNAIIKGEVVCASKNCAIIVFNDEDYEYHRIIDYYSQKNLFENFLIKYFDFAYNFYCMEFTKYQDLVTNLKKMTQVGKKPKEFEIKSFFTKNKPTKIKNSAAEILKLLKS